MSLPGDLEKLIVVDAYRQRTVETQRESLARAYGPIRFPRFALFQRMADWLKQRQPKPNRQPPRQIAKHRRRLGW